MTEKINNLLKNLSLKEREVVSLLLGLNDGRPRSSEEVAQLYALDADSVTKIFGQAITKIPISFEELKTISEKVQEELKAKTPEGKQRRTLADIDIELLKINFFEDK